MLKNCMHVSIVSYGAYFHAFSFADHNLIEDPLHYGSEGFPPRGNTYDARKLTFEPWVNSPNIRRL